MSDIYIKQNKPDKALEYASRSLKLAQKIRTQETNKQMKTIRTVPEIWEL
jgi:hypothetical protein